MSKKNDVILSISLIVKNEEDNLSRCLDSLKPIMEALPCQLIITDTGSTDKTVEIAKDYTDEVYFFEWCDNFAAARNFGLEKAKGQWLMFIDADEWFEDATEIIDFFKSGEYKKYNSASYIVKNYINYLDRSDYVDSRLHRLYKLDNDTKFIGEIHEYIPTMNPTKAFKAFVHHYSYASNNNDEYRKKKYLRNIKPLLKAFELESNNIRTRYQLAQEYKAAGQISKYEELVEETFELIKDDYSNPYYPYFLKFKTKFYKENEPQKGITLLEKYLKNAEKQKIWDLDILANIADLCHKAGEYEKAIKYCDQYFKLLEKYLNGKIKEDLSFTAASPLFISREFGITIHNLKAKCYLLLDKEEDALNTMKDVDFEIIPLVDIDDNLKLLLHCVSKLESWKTIPVKYAEVLKNQENQKREKFINILEEFILNNKKVVTVIGQAFSESDQLNDYKDDNYVLLQKLRQCITVRAAETVEVTRKFLDNNSDKLIDPLYAEFVMQSILLQESMDSYLELIDVDDINKYVEKIFTIYGNLDEAFYNAFTATNFKFMDKSRKLLFWQLCILERCLLISRHKEEEFRMDLIKLYLKQGESYIEYIYNSEILKEQQIMILPRSYRFIYFASIAMSCIDKGHFEKAVEMLKSAVTSYPILSSEVGLLLDRIQKRKINEEQLRKTKKVEFEQYSEDIKNKIVFIAQNGMRDEAIELLKSYIKINPNDKQGITELERRLDLDN